MIENDRYLLIRYESLIEHFDETVSRLARFLEIDEHPLLFTPSKGHGKTNWRGNAASYRPTHGISNAGVAKWKVVLTHSEAVRIERLLHEETDWCGYKLSEEPADNLSFITDHSEKLFREMKYHIYSQLLLSNMFQSEHMAQSLYNKNKNYNFQSLFLIQ